MPSIGAAANVYNEVNAIAGWLENVAQTFDHITVYHTGPGGAYSDDGTIEICEKFGVDIQYGSIDEGFGVVRTKLITITPCEWVMIMDADERFHRFAPVLTIENDEVRVLCGYDQSAALRDTIANPKIDAVVTSRRHWQTFHWNLPCQNFIEIPDWQCRIVRNCEHVVYRADIAMHEQIIDKRTGQGPTWYQPEVANCRIFHDHYHSFFKPMESEQRAHDVAIYDAIHEGKKPPSRDDFMVGKGGLS